MTEWPKATDTFVIDLDINAIYPEPPIAGLAGIHNRAHETEGRLTVQEIPGPKINRGSSHDPYQNKDTQITFQCVACPAIVDPLTRSFAALCKAASDANWFIRWGDTTYEAICFKCGTARGMKHDD